MNYLLQVRWAVVCLAFVLLATVAAHSQTLAIDTKLLRYRAGVRNTPGARQLNSEERRQIVQSLRAKTGWQTLDFDDDGFLVCPEPQLFRGGSAAARRLLGAALWGNEIYELEAYSNSAAVSFGMLAAGVTYQSDRLGARINMRLVQLDFADLRRLEGEKLALQAFDVGLIILHELAHGVWHLRDATTLEAEPGECETFINQIRRELHLPERQSYRARVRSIRFHIALGTRLLAELHFSATPTQGQGKGKRYRLRWDAEAVGPIKGFNRPAKASVTTALR